MGGHTGREHSQNLFFKGNGNLKTKKNGKMKMLDFRPLEGRNRPRDCDFRNLREKLYRIPKFSSKSVPWGPVSWPSKDFGPDRS